LHKRRLLREVESSEYRLQAGQDRAAAQDRVHVEGRTIQTRVNAVLQTAPEPPEGVTTNGVETEDEARQTKPIGVSSSEERDSGEAIVEEVGRGRPTCEEPPEGGTPNADAFGETKPMGAGGVDEQRGGSARGEDVGQGRPGYEEASGDATTNGETKPIGDGEDPSGAIPFVRVGASRGAPSASFCSVRP
jgi:hypothetical protein